MNGERGRTDDEHAHGGDARNCHVRWATFRRSVCSEASSSLVFLIIHAAFHGLCKHCARHCSPDLPDCDG